MIFVSQLLMLITASLVYKSDHKIKNYFIEAFKIFKSIWMTDDK